MSRDRLRGLGLNEDKAEDGNTNKTGSGGQSNGSPTDEQFLNILRKGDRPFLETAVFAEELDIVQRTAQKRLKGLEEDGRVKSEQIGQPKLWWLSESEPQEPVKEKGAQLLRISKRLDDFTRGIGYVTLGLFGMAGFFLLIYLTANAQNIVFPYFGNEGVTFGALLLAFSAGIGMILWGTFKCISILLRRALNQGSIGTIGT